GGTRRLALEEFLVGAKRHALAPGELIVAVIVRPSGAAQTFMKVGPRNAMVIAVCSLAVAVDQERGEVRAAFGSAGPVPMLVRAPLAEAEGFPALVASAASPIDDVRGTAAYRRHALRVLAPRGLERCLAAAPFPVCFPRGPSAPFPPFLRVAVKSSRVWRKGVTKPR